jgi:hypothetical protein
MFSVICISFTETYVSLSTFWELDEKIVIAAVDMQTSEYRYVMLPCPVDVGY